VKIVCGCCEPAAPSTPRLVDNRPSLSAIGYRIGTYASFRESMLRALAEAPELAMLTTRESDDYGITVLELWAAVADVLTFHQERYVNEVYLRTAGFSDSVARVARLIDYRPRPGVAARTWLAFTLDAGKRLTIPLGQKVQSVPEQDQVPQTFETLEPVAADARLNRLRVFPLPVNVNSLPAGDLTATLDRLQGPSLAAFFAPGDAIVLFNDGGTATVEEKKIDAILRLDDRVTVRWSAPVRQSTWTAATAAFKTKRTFRLFGHNAPPTVVQPTQLSTPSRIVWNLKTITDFDQAATTTIKLDARYPNLAVGTKLLIDDTGTQPGFGGIRPDLTSVIGGTSGLTTLIGSAFGPVSSIGSSLGFTSLSGGSAGFSPLGGGALDPTSLIGGSSGVSPLIGGALDPTLVGGTSGFTPVVGAVPGLTTLIGSAGRKTLVTIQSVTQVTASFPSTGTPVLSDSVTQITVTPQIPAINDLRRVIVHELGETPLAFWSQDYPASITGDTLYLPGVAVTDAQGAGIEVGRTIERNEFKPGVVLHVNDIQKGRTLLVDDARGHPVRATVKNVPSIVPAGTAPGQFCHLAIPLTLTTPLGHDTATAVLLGNAAASSHGETVRDEALGGGDASVTFPRFGLKKKPLTYLPGKGPDGLVASLEVRIAGLRWREVAGLYGQPPDAAVYEVRTAEDGASVIQFGDGVAGAVPPTGRANVTATYRVGAGLAGRVAANALTTLLAKPTGLAAATNPIAAEGGADPETLAMARESAPRTVRTFGRAVSLRDFEDLVTASGEIAKAYATFVWDGLDRAIHLTIAGQGGALLSDQARRDLGEILKASRDPNHRLLIANHVKVFVELEAGVAVHPDYDRDLVLGQVRAAVLAALSFDTLRLGQPLHLSDLVRIMQDVPGVVFVDVDRLLFKKPAGMTNAQYHAYLAARGATFLAGGVPAPVQGHLRIFQARPDPGHPGTVLAAELAAVESPTLDVTIETREA
jgi:hypothetical protein